MDLKQAREKYSELTARMKAYNYAMSLSGWDMATLAPSKGKAGAAKAIGILSGEAFSLKVSPETRAIMDAFEAHAGEITEVEAREIQLLREETEKLDKIPKSEYQEFSELQANSQVVWEEAKEKSDFEMFAPYLEKVLYFTRRFAKLTNPSLHPYNSCLDDYEKGLTMEELDRFFGAVREKTVPLVDRIAREGREIRADFLSRSFPPASQSGFSYKLLELMGFDLEAGILAASEHPFTIGIVGGDVRLTTHYYENNFTSAMLSTVHEGGHGIYEQNASISPIVRGTMLDSGVSMGIHESQSRFYENIVCRSRVFWEYFYPALQDTYPEQLRDVTLDEFYRAINISKSGYIRIEADELTYNLHIMVRYELEKALMEDQVAIGDLPRLWNEKYEEYLGVTPRNNKEGVLQDVHWSGGMIGYFPSYALGNAYAAQIFHTMKKSLDFDGLCKRGQLKNITAWLGEHVHQYGMLKTPGNLIHDISGEPLNPAYLTDYLQNKIESIYF